MERRMSAGVARMIGRGTNAGRFCAAAKPRLKLRFIALLCIAFGSAPLPLFAEGQSNAALIHFDSQTQVFRIDATDMSYMFGINEKKQLQAIYWGKRLSSADTLAMPHSDSDLSAFESSINTTQQEFVGWGGGLYVEPDLKVTFPDGNRDLVLEYVSHRIDGSQLTILLKDISREVYVELQYHVDATTGILRRSAQVQNRTSAPLTVEEIASGTWNLPRGTDYR